MLKVAKPQPGSAPHSGPDHRAPPAKDSPCPGCKHMRARNDWEHTRVIGECKYPYDAPWVPGCEACQNRMPRYHWEHVFDGSCMWGQPEVPRERRSSSRPHEPRQKAHKEPTVGIPANVDGEELAKGAEEKVAEADRRRGGFTDPPREKPQEKRRRLCSSASSCARSSSTGPPR